MLGRCSLTRLVLEWFLPSFLKVSAHGGSPGAARQVPPALGRGSPGLRSLVPQPQVLVLFKYAFNILVVSDGMF